MSHAASFHSQVLSPGPLSRRIPVVKSESPSRHLRRFIRVAAATSVGVLLALLDW